MIANAPTFNTTTGIDYTLNPTEHGWQLTVWEEAAVTQNRVNPFLWKFRVELATLNEAHSTLHAILGEHKGLI